MTAEVRLTPPADWLAVASQCRTLTQEVAALMTLLTRTEVAAASDGRLRAAARAAEAAQNVIATLTEMPDMAAPVRSVLRFQTALLAWHRAVCECSAIEMRFQTALLQQASQVLTSSLHLESHAQDEAARVAATGLH